MRECLGYFLYHSVSEWLLFLGVLYNSLPVNQGSIEQTQESLVVVCRLLRFNWSPMTTLSRRRQKERDVRINLFNNSGLICLKIQDVRVDC